MLEVNTWPTPMKPAASALPATTLNISRSRVASRPKFFMAATYQRLGKTKMLPGRFQFTIAADQVVGRAVMFEPGRRFAFQFGNDALRQRLAQFDAPIDQKNSRSRSCPE